MTQSELLMTTSSLAIGLREKGYNYDQVMEIIVLMAEEIYKADLQGYARGYGHGWAENREFTNQLKKEINES